jgi:PAS domain S-box-containing protein
VIDAEKPPPQSPPEARFRATLPGVDDGVTATDPQGRTDLMNPAAERPTGWLEVEARGKPLDEVLRIVNEEARAAVEDPAQRVLREGLAMGLANYALPIAGDGTEWPIADSGAPRRDAAGAVTGVVQVLRDWLMNAKPTMRSENRAIEPFGGSQSAFRKRA